MFTGRGTAIALACAVTIVAGTAAQTIQINGAGATFAYPIYSKWFAEYNKLHSDIQINYQSIGSGGGIRQIQAQTVFFGATEGPMTPEQLQASPGRILHFPTVLGAVVPVYHIPNLRTELKFTGQVLADIFLGKITNWNDPHIAKLNDGVSLPATHITVVHRADGSGTTYIWVDYLSKVSIEWRAKVGINTSVKWPTGVGGRNERAGLASQTPGSIVYVELIYACRTRSATAQQNMPASSCKGQRRIGDSGRPAVSQMPPISACRSRTRREGRYPISSFTRPLLRKPQERQSKAMVD